MEETIAQKLKRLCDERAAEIRQAQKEGKVVESKFKVELEVEHPTLEEMLADPTLVFNGELPTEEEIAKNLERYANRKTGPSNYR